MIAVDKVNNAHEGTPRGRRGARRKVVMLVSRHGSENGIDIKRFDKGQEYEIAERLARIFLAEGWADEVQTEAAVTAGEVAPSEPAKPAAFAPMAEAVVKLDAVLKNLRNPKPTKGK